MTNSGRKILVIEDDMLVFQVIEKSLSLCGVGLVHVRDGYQAKEQLSKNGGSFALAIVDLILSRDLTGWNILDVIRGNPATSGMSVVVLTSVELSVEEGQRLREKADLVLQKQDFTVHGFTKAIEGLLEDIGK